MRESSQWEELASASSESNLSAGCALAAGSSAAPNSALALKRLYLDSNALIRFVERRDPMRAKIGATRASTVEDGQSIVVGGLGVVERLYGAYKGAYKLGSAELESRYSEILAIFDIVPVGGERLGAAARLGARKSLKLVEAVHFVAAIERKCQPFLTDDERTRSGDGVTIIRVTDL